MLQSNFFILDQFDKQELFINYFPMNNYDIVIRRIQKLRNNFIHKRGITVFSNYTMYFLQMRKAQKMRKQLEEPVVEKK